jgi:hypothetical protein
MSAIVLSEAIEGAYFFTIKTRMPFDDMRVMGLSEFDSDKFLLRGGRQCFIA